MEVEEKSILDELVNEVKSYLPAMKGHLNALRLDQNDSHAAEELHRLTHTINGASSMVGLSDLSKSALLLENIINDILAGKNEWNSELINTLFTVVEAFEKYFDSLPGDDAVGSELLETTTSLVDTFLDQSTTVKAPVQEETLSLEDILFADQDDSEDPKAGNALLVGLSDEEESIDDLPGLESFLAESKEVEDTASDAADPADGNEPEAAENKSFQAESSDITPPDPEPQQQPSSFEQEMRESFLEEASEHLSILNTELNVLESEIIEPAAITESIKKRLHIIRRGVHTLKGAAAVVGIETVAAWGHSFEDFLDWLHDDAQRVSPDLIGSMIDGTELLDGLVEDPNLETDQITGELLARFKQFMENDSRQIKDTTSQPPEPQPETAKNESAIDTELQQSFDDESEEYLEGIGRQLNLLARIVQEPTVIDKELLHILKTIYRAVHGIKGGAAVIGHTTMVEWAGEFETFLDSLLTRTEALTAEIVTAMVQASDVLEHFCEQPDIDQTRRMHEIRKSFVTVLQKPEKDGPLFSESASPQPTRHQANNDEQITIRPRQTRSTNTLLRKKTLRVRGDKLERISGLGGDLSINLGSFENSDHSMQTIFSDFSMVLQRFKGIASSLEAGYELATIPHFGTMEGPGHDNNSLLDEFDPLELDRYSELNILIRSMQEAVLDLESIMDQGQGIRQTWHRAVERQNKLVSEVQTAIQSIQMTPFSTLANRLYRTVREASRATKKNVRLVIEGGSIEMDTHVWDVLADPLMHMLRNAVDHGIENKKDRQIAGKPDQATIRIHCTRRGSHFVLRLSDDGSGLNYDAIRARAGKLYPDMDTENMGRGELAALIFRQGFSVRTKVSNISGRGVGMDVVRNGLELLNGNIEVKSARGAGVEFIISIPIVVAQLPALIVSFGDQTFALPMSDINRIIRIPVQDAKGQTLVIKGKTIPVLRPAEIFQITAPGLQGTDHASSQLGILAEIADKQCILIADQILGRKEIVLKNLSQPLDNIPFIAGATIMGDGSLIPILKIEDLLNAEQPKSVSTETGQKETEEKKLSVLFADDSISIRKVLDKFISYHGWLPIAAHDGVDAMEKVREHRPDLIILDIEMPRMNGFEVLQSLQSQAGYRDIPVLMLTSRTAGKYREKATTLGARGFVTKPFKDQDLKALITTLTQQ